MKRVFLTGASSGIGAAAARLLLEKGHQVFMTSRDASRLESLAIAFPATAFTASLDVRHPEEVRRVVSEASNRMGGLDVLINNAGLGYFAPLPEAQLAHWLEMVETNVSGLLSCIHAALPHLLESGGHVINLGSVASHLVFPNSGIYCATKHAVLAISESLRIELAGRIRVTTISPGAVNTPFIERTPDEKLRQELQPGFLSGLSPEQIAGAILSAMESPPGTMISEIIIRPSKVHPVR